MNNQMGISDYRLLAIASACAAGIDPLLLISIRTNEIASDQSIRKPDS